MYILHKSYHNILLKTSKAVIEKDLLFYKRDFTQLVFLLYM